MFTSFDPTPIGVKFQFKRLKELMKLEKDVIEADVVLLHLPQPLFVLQVGLFLPPEMVGVLVVCQSNRYSNDFQKIIHCAERCAISTFACLAIFVVDIFSTTGCQLDQLSMAGGEPVELLVKC